MKYMFAVITLLVGLNAWGTDYYVSSVNPVGNDSNPGTSPNAPWATYAKIQAVWPSLNPGDTIHLNKGSEWDVSLTDAWYVTHGGSAGSPITLRGDDYGTGASPILKRTGGGVAATFVGIQASYVTFQGFTIDGGNSGYGQNTGGITIFPNTSNLSTIQILNMTIQDLGGTSATYTCGIWIAASGGYNIDSCLIQGNFVSGYSAHGLNHYPQPGGGTITNTIWRNNVVMNSYTGGRFPGANSAMQISTGGGGNIIEYNYFSDTTTDQGCVFLFGKNESDTSPNNICYNVIANSDVYGVLFAVDQSGYKILDNVFDNIIYGCTKAGIYVAPSNSYAAGSTLNFYNNTLFRCDTSAASGAIYINNNCANTAINVANNLIDHAAASFGFEVASTWTGTALTHNNNLYWHEGGPGTNVISYNGTSYTVAEATAFEVSAKNSSPQFVNTSQLPAQVSSSGGTVPSGLSVLSSSPAVAGGANLGSAYAMDIQSQVRPSGPWTMGAYQVSSAATAAPTGLRLSQ